MFHFGDLEHHQNKYLLKIISIFGCENQGDPPWLSLAELRPKRSSARSGWLIWLMTVECYRYTEMNIRNMYT